MKIIKFIIDNFDDLAVYAIACIVLGVVSVLVYMLAVGDFTPCIQVITDFITSVFNSNPYLFVFCIGAGLGVIYTIIDYKTFYSFYNYYHFNEEDLENK